MAQNAGSQSRGASECLRSEGEGVLTRWRKAVSQVLPQADKTTVEQFERAVPALLQRIGQMLDASVSASTAQLFAESPVPGFSPYHPQFSLSELIIEHHLLRRAVLDHLTAALQRPLSTGQVVAIDQVIDVALRQTATAYADYLAQRLETDAAAAGSFLSLVSHDLRGGINGAMLMVEVLRREIGADPKFTALLADLDMVRFSLLDTVKMMESFVDAERLRRGRLTVKPAPVKIAQLLGQVHKSVAYQLQQQEMTLTVKADTGLTITSDPQLLSMILQNLVGNAIKHGRRGDIQLVAAGPAEAPAGVVCRISVTDQGPGIAPEKLSRLMKPLDADATYGRKDLGLGLFIARRAAELLGANLSAESDVGHGATFHLDLPKQA